LSACGGFTSVLGFDSQPGYCFSVFKPHFLASERRFLSKIKQDLA